VDDSTKAGQNFILLDDDKSLNALASNFKSQIIQPIDSDGLTAESANKALEILNDSNLEIVLDSKQAGFLFFCLAASSKSKA
jgi:hypothetical protein